MARRRRPQRTPQLGGVTARRRGRLQCFRPSPLLFTCTGLRDRGSSCGTAAGVAPSRALWGAERRCWIPSVSNQRRNGILWRWRCPPVLHPADLPQEAAWSVAQRSWSVRHPGCATRGATSIGGLLFGARLAVELPAAGAVIARGQRAPRPYWLDFAAARGASATGTGARKLGPILGSAAGAGATSGVSAFCTLPVTCTWPLSFFCSGQGTRSTRLRDAESRPD